MQKREFLADQDTTNFVSYLTGILNEAQPLAFQHSQGTYQTIHDALASYSWPNKRINIPTPDGQLIINAHSNFQDNKEVLDKLEIGIRSAFSQDDSSTLANWAQAIMIWGGVYTRRGNGCWLDSQRIEFGRYLKRAVAVLGKEDDNAPTTFTELRSNAGTTKIHSLLLPNFVIYDSRVAGALAWLVFQWANCIPDTIPEHLRFACMRANTTKEKKRSPHLPTFPYFAATEGWHHHHAKWNLRANWIIEATIAAQKTLLSPRELEAGLFMMGNDLSYSL